MQVEKGINKIYVVILEALFGPTFRPRTDVLECMSMLRLLSVCLAAAALHAQDVASLFNKPPAGVDEALRARISEFLEYHVKQQFRQAEALVADDTKEFFYSHNKPQYLSFEIQRIDYSDNFTKAKAVILCEQYIMAPGFTDKPMKVPEPSYWKLVNGKWYWYVDQEALRQTAFGKMTPGPGKPGSLPPVPDSAAFIMGKVKADKQAVTLRRGEDVQIKLANSAPGFMSLVVTGKPQGIEAELDRAQVGRDATAVLTIRAKNEAKSGPVRIRIDPTGETIDIAVSVNGTAEPALPPPAPKAPDVTTVKITADKKAVTLRAGGRVQVKLANSGPGVMTLAVTGKPEGIEAELDHAQVARGATAVLTIRAKSRAKSGSVSIRVDPTPEVIAIAVSVK